MLRYLSPEFRSWRYALQKIITSIDISIIDLNYLKLVYREFQASNGTMRLNDLKMYLGQKHIVGLGKNNGKRCALYSCNNFLSKESLDTILKKDRVKFLLYFCSEECQTMYDFQVLDKK